MAPGREHPRTPGARGTLAVLAVVQFTTTAEFTVVYVALPTVVADLGLGGDLTPWVIGAHAVLFAGLLVVGGRVVDRVGAGVVLRVALGGFVTASALGALAPSGAVLVVARGGQGVASAFLQPAVLALLATTFPSGPARDRALGVWSGVGAVGLAAGALGGGLLTALSWRATMAAPIPLAALAALGVPRAGSRPGGARPPVASAALGTGAVLALVGVLTATAAAVPLLGVAAALGAGFVLVERRGRAVLVDPVLRRTRSLRIGAGATAVYMAGAGSAYFLLTAFFAADRGYGPVRAGAAFLPLMAATTVGCWLAARALARHDAAVLLAAGFGAVALGLGGLAVAVDAPFAGLLGWLVVGGLGNGVVYTTMVAVGLRDVRPEHQGTAGALLTTAQYVASGVAVAALGLVLAAGARVAFLVAAAVSLVGLVPALLARRVPPGVCDDHAVSRIEVPRVIEADPHTIFEVLRDPQGHVRIDSSGMLMAATGGPVSAVGDEFVVHMDREALNDRPLGRYDVTVTISAFEQDREIAWTIVGVSRPPIGHVYGYRLEPVDDGTRVVSYYDWSDIHPEWAAKDVFPIISEQALRATLGILARTVR